jgi:uncharacterized protein (TIGR03067 family)
MFRIVVLASLGWVAGLVGAAAPPGDLLEREQQRLEGTWRVTAAEAEGMAIPAREFRDLRLTFKDGKFTARRGNEEAQEGTYVIDPSSNPKEMDITRTNGPDRGKKQLAVYSLAGDLLKICSCETGTERPSGFDTRDRPGHTLMTLRRVR